jgi:hypothetical protein
MTSDDRVQREDDNNEVTALPVRNAMHYDSGVFERVDWTHGASHMQANHGTTPEIATEALGDPDRVVIDPDYNSTSGKSVRIIGFSTTADELITVMVVVDDGVEYGANGWASNAKDRRIYNEGSYQAGEGEVDGQDD